MEVLVAAIIGVVACAIFAALTFLARNWTRVAEVLLATTLRRDAAYRISVASLIKLPTSDSKYILFRMLPTRPEAFAPPGGVRKSYETAQPRLDSLEFVPEFSPASTTEHRNDLRGQLSGRHLAAFLRWVRQTGEVESATDAARRELLEESKLCGAGNTLAHVSQISFRVLRNVIELRPTRAYRQVRLLTVLEPVESDAAKQLVEILTAASATSPNIDCVTRADIQAGRTLTDAPIAPTADYLFAKRSSRPDLPPLRAKG